MGLDSSQARLLSLTSRLFDIHGNERQLTHVKDRLAQDTNRISKEYNEALKGKVLKWSRDQVTYNDLTYATLMRPNTANGNKPIFLTNSHGKIMLDKKYSDYARRISPDGRPVGDWLGSDNKDRRIAILSELTGISSEKIENTTDMTARIADLENKTQKYRDKNIKDIDTKEFIKYMGSIQGHDYSHPDDSSYDNNISSEIYTVALGSGHQQEFSMEYQAPCALGADAESAKAGLQDILNQIQKNIQQYLEPEDFERFKEACKNTYDIYCNKIDIAEPDQLATVDVSKETANGQICVGLYYLIENLVKQYCGSDFYPFSPLSGNTDFTVVPKSINSDEYKEYQADCEELEQMRNENNIALTASEESQIKFYDQIFTAVCERGWVEDYQITDQEYLNQMLQNNEFFVTTVNENDPACRCENNDDLTCGHLDYSTDLWSDTENIFAVNDEAIRQEALTEYEYKKSLIAAKEKRIDEKVENLKTEQNAIQKAIDGIKQVMSDNSETYFGIFT